jgi:Zn-dependent peptidase ImmA (M78 family)
MADARAFSFADFLPYLIFINTSDTEGAKNFSLMHEFAHILLREEAICNDFKSFNGTDPAETFCNRFAGSFLVPEKEFRSHPLLEKKKNISEKEIDSLASQLAMAFKVSRFVILRRLLTFKFIGTDLYDKKADAWSDEIPPKKKGGTFSVKQYVTKNGRRYSGLVMNAYKQRKISHSKVTDYLGFKSRHLKSFEKLFS